jgi:lipid-A-disaccharide synthase
MVVAYRMGGVSWWLMSRLVSTPHVALPNLLAGKLLVPELLQQAATPDALAAAVRPLLAGAEASARQLQGFEELRERLGRGAADEVASALLELVATARTQRG